MRTLQTNGLTPPALAIAITLCEKGLDFEFVAHDWRDTPTALEPFGDRLELTNSLEGEFPILVDGDVAVSDSFFVLEYLDDKYPTPPLKPDDAFGQWQVQAFARFLGERASPAVSTLGVAQRFAGHEAVDDAIAAFTGASILPSERRDAWTQALRGPQDDSLITESRRQLDLLVQRIEKALADNGGPWLLGERYTLADIGAYALAHPFIDGRLEAGDIVFGRMVRDWHGRADARPAVRNAVALREPAFRPGPEHSRWG